MQPLITYLLLLFIMLSFCAASKIPSLRHLALHAIIKSFPPKTVIKHVGLVLQVFNAHESELCFKGLSSSWIAFFGDMREWKDDRKQGEYIWSLFFLRKCENSSELHSNLSDHLHGAGYHTYRFLDAVYQEDPLQALLQYLPFQDELFQPPKSKWTIVSSKQDIKSLNSLTCLLMGVLKGRMPKAHTAIVKAVGHRDLQVYKYLKEARDKKNYDGAEMTKVLVNAKTFLHAAAAIAKFRIEDRKAFKKYFADKPELQPYLLYGFHDLMKALH